MPSRTLPQYANASSPLIITNAPQVDKLHPVAIHGNEVKNEASFPLLARVMRSSVAGASLWGDVLGIRSTRSPIRFLFASYHFFVINL
jgi:hypothetical protein